MAELVIIGIVIYFGKMIYEIVTQGIAQAKVKAHIDEQIRIIDRKRKNGEL